MVKNGRYAGRVSDAIHSSLADIQASLTSSHRAESADGTVRAEASAKRQIALELSPAAMRLRPDDLAELILSTQQEAQRQAEAAVAERLDTFRADPRVTDALERLRDTQAAPPPRPVADAPDPDDDVITDVYDKNSSW